MMTENAVLERMLSEADPAPTPRDAAPDARALATRDRILRTSTAPSRRRVRAVGWASGLVAAAACAAVAFTLMMPTGAAVAGTPSPLAFGESETVAEIVDAAEVDLAAVPGPAEPERHVRAASWTLSLDDAKITPQFSVLTWNADLSGRVVMYAGVPYESTDAVANNSAEVRSSGEVTMDLVMAPGEFSTPVPEAPGASHDELMAALHAFGMPDSPNAFEVATAITSLIEQWTLTNAQHAELLSIVENTAGVEGLGIATDRLGRSVLGMRMVSGDGDASNVLLVSADTGRIVGLETIALRDVGGAPVGAVTGYRMWGLGEGAAE